MPTGRTSPHRGEHMIIHEPALYLVGLRCGATCVYPCGWSWSRVVSHVWASCWRPSGAHRHVIQMRTHDCGLLSGVLHHVCVPYCDPCVFPRGSFELGVELSCSPRRTPFDFPLSYGVDCHRSCEFFFCRGFFEEWLPYPSRVRPEPGGLPPPRTPPFFFFFRLRRASDA